MNNERAAELRKSIIALALPSMGEHILKMTIGVVDTAFVGRLSPEALAVSGLSWSILFFFSMLAFGMNTGATAVVARLLGGEKNEETKKAAGQSIVLNLTFTTVITIIIMVFAERFFILLGAEPEVIKTGARFLRILTTTYVFSGLMLGAHSIIKASGDTKTPMKIFAAVNALNIFLDYCLIFGKLGFPRHGVLGSAEASALVRVPGAFLAFGGIMLGWYGIKLKFKHFFPVSWKMIGRVVRIGGPATVESMVFSSATVAFVWIVTQLGTEPLAAHNVLLRAESFSFMPGIGFMVAAQIAVGRALGEGDREKTDFLAWESVKMGSIIMGFMGVIFFTIPHLFIKIFTDSPEVIRLGAHTLRIISIIQPVQGLMFVLMGILKGAGDTRTTMKFSIVGMWAIRVPLAYLFAIVLNLGVAGAWAGMCIDIAMRALFYLHRFRGKEWAEIEV